ncbi:fatty acid-binding protein DegV [Sutcliffiella cohnii]|uniref:Fatty acid-binding protein DegV n=1 Tax=Sutcliffiella cohnii TaxID=33932 RepID=A0A223KM86_9BACI|nr:DegV family protein [Sutcliffiella cohnii]AST90572.1 fatty acid-binding protein DegV [Sutcliffiella cohnii]
MGIKIIVDSACDLPKSYLEENNVELLSLKVLYNEKEYDDMVSIQAKEVFDAMREGAVIKTSQAAPTQAKEVFENIAKNKESAIYIAFSSELSGTYQMAMLMKNDVLEEYPGLDVTIINTKGASLGIGLIVKRAVELANIGASKEEIIAEVEKYVAQMEYVFTVDNLDYLARGGRVSKASAFVGGLLNIKPLLHMEDGKLIPIEKIRGRKKVLRRMVDLMKERGGSFENQTIAISHGDDEETALVLKEMIQTETGANDFYIHSIGSAIGAHAGPGTIALFFLNKDYF